MLAPMQVHPTDSAQDIRAARWIGRRGLWIVDVILLVMMVLLCVLSL